jgi:fluoroacetyl-CoA thioesterase
MRPISEGAEGVFALTVAPEHLANQFKDAALPPVLATPVMIMIMENAALNAIKPYLDAGESAVGTHVDVRHLVATPVGNRVTATARVKRAVGRHVEFDVRATDSTEEIGRGSHARAIIDMAKFLERLRAKR